MAEGDAAVSGAEDGAEEGDGVVRSEADLRRYDTVEELLRDKLSEALGGWRGAVESAVPTLAFALVWARTENLRTALVVAGVCVAVLLVVRLVQRQDPRFIAYAAVGSGHFRLLRAPVGSGEDAFLPGMLQNAGLLVLLLVTNLTRWPLFGFVVGVAEPEAFAENPTWWRRHSGIVTVASPTGVGAHRTQRRAAGDHGAALPRRAGGGARGGQGRPGLAGIPRRHHGHGRHPAARSHTDRPEPPGLTPDLGRRTSRAAGLRFAVGVVPLAGSHEVLEAVLLLGRRDEEQLVAGLDRVVRRRSERALLTDDRHEHGVGRPVDVADAPACERAAFGRVISTIEARPCWNSKMRTRSPMLTASSMSAVMRRGVDTATSTPQASSNIHSFFGLLTRATVRGTPNSVLASSESTRLALSSPVAATTRRDSSSPASSRAAISQASASSHDASGTRDGLDVVGVLVDEQHLVPVSEQLTGDGAADASGSGDDDAHGGVFS